MAEDDATTNGAASSSDGPDAMPNTDADEAAAAEMMRMLEQAQSGGASQQASSSGTQASPMDAFASGGGTAVLEGDPPDMPDLTATGAGLSAEAQSTIDMLGDVELHVTVELGRTEMLVEDVLRLAAGSVVELDKLAGDPVDVFVNGRLVARGEVLVLNDSFCIRISEIVDDLERQAQEAAEQAAQEQG